MEKRINKIESRLDDLSEEFYQSEDTKAKKKVGKIQTKTRKIVEKVKNLESKVESQSNRVDRISKEEDILEEVKKMRKETEETLQEAEQEIQDRKYDAMTELEKEIEKAEDLADKIGDKLERYADLLEEFEEERSKVHDQYLIQQSNMSFMKNMQAFSLIQSKMPDGEIQTMFVDKVCDSHQMTEQQRADLLSTIVNWFRLIENDFEGSYETDDVVGEDMLKAYLVQQRLHKESNGIWNNLDDYIDDDKPVDHFIEKTEEGDILIDAINKVLGEPPEEFFLGNHDKNPVVEFKEFVSDEKKEEAVEWFEDYFETMSEEEALEKLRGKSEGLV